MGNVLTRISIAAGSGLHQKAIFIGQLYRQAVQLEHQHDHLLSRKAQKLRAALRFIQRQQWDRMRCFHQGADSGIAAYRLRGRVRHAEAGLLFQRT